MSATVTLAHPKMGSSSGKVEPVNGKQELFFKFLANGDGKVARVCSTMSELNAWILS